MAQPKLIEDTLPQGAEVMAIPPGGESGSGPAQQGVARKGAISASPRPAGPAGPVLPLAKKSRRGERGNAILIGALAIVLALGLFALIVDGALAYTQDAHLASYAREVATAGATAIDLNNFASTGQAHLIPKLATQQANQFYDNLKLGPDFQMQILAVDANHITVQISHVQQLYLIKAFIPVQSIAISAQATAIPQIGL